MKTFVTSFVILASVAIHASTAPVGETAPSTFCNPLPIPDYPIGREARNATVGEPCAGQGLWLSEKKEQFRELADPAALWHEGKWFLYPSVDMAWVSADNGATWQHHPLNVRDLGYAPTIVKHRGKFLLMASDSPLYSSDSPLGPFAEVGRIQVPRVAGMPGFTDPMLFSDEDGKLFFYWGCTASGGIWGVELDAAKLTNTVSTPKELFRFDPVAQPWQAVGDWNQNTTAGWMEGSWMVKHGGKYFLTFSAAGTENRTYAMGCYLGSSPLGPFTLQKRTPFFRNTEGLITGTGHGCIVAGPENQL